MVGPSKATGRSELGDGRGEVEDASVGSAAIYDAVPDNDGVDEAP